ncbi:uncharacterized protein EI90DRAFT_3015006 [Cantharellus anzutake]|uniref:uncharacterized protein n=1 Tax=Cantharellus anzutake TaxID=1750568 RepID=UPI0019058279|nr:uncharacterized protein EI90DRAFT_3015006 [Cantharellus anzutake]KAF8334776.1 hypothetical protein EI90DRAFT_3015006 [Cantharellus anzutake]
MTNCTSLKEIDDMCKDGRSTADKGLLIETTDAQHALFTSVTACTHSDPLRLNSPEGKAGMSPSVVSSSSRLSTTLPKAQTKRKRLTKEYVHHFDTIGRTRASRLHLPSTPDPSPIISETQPTSEYMGETTISNGVTDSPAGTVKWKDEISDENELLTVGIVDVFLGVIHPTLKKLPLDLLRKVKGPLRKLRDEYLEVVDNKDSLERDLYAPFAEMVSSIIKANGGRDRLRENAREEEASRDLNPDGVFVRKRRGRRAPTSPDQVHWRDILFPIDLKRKENCRASLLSLTSDSEMTEEQKERESEKVGEATLDGRQ